MKRPPLVHVVDDSTEVCDSLRLLFKTVAIDVETFANAEAFMAHLATSTARPSCLLLDVRMPGMSGMSLLKWLRESEPTIPIVMITGHGDIDMAVQAMKLGAADFVTKPFGAQALLDGVQAVLGAATQAVTTPDQDGDAIAARWETLTPREREIFQRIVSGAPSKAIALDLDLSVRTVESHRARIMDKMQARNLAHLVRLSLILERPGPGLRT